MGDGFQFGLVHGFGFSFALRSRCSLRSHLLNVAVVQPGRGAGQLAVLVEVPVLQLLFRFVVSERIRTIILSALIAHAHGTGRTS
jgi:hypothetical protein